MIRFDRILASFKGGTVATTLAVGFRQTPVTNSMAVTGINLLSASGLYFDDASSIINADNIFNLHPNDNINSSDFNTYLTRMHDAALTEICSELIFGKASLVDSVNLFPFEKELSDTLDLTEQFVGIEFNPSSSIDIAGIVPFIELSFDSAVTFNLYLFNSNKKAYVKKQSCTTVANQPTIVDLSDWFIADGNDFKGGNFYIGYFLADISTAKPFAKSTDILLNANRPKLVKIDYVGMNGSAETIDITTKTQLTDSAGINLGINIFNDYTELIIRNKQLIYPLLQYKFIEKMLNLIMFSIRSNRVKNATSDMLDDIYFELYGNKDRGIVGIVGKLTERMNSVKAMLFNEEIKQPEEA